MTAVSPATRDVAIAEAGVGVKNRPRARHEATSRHDQSRNNSPRLSSSAPSNRRRYIDTRYTRDAGNLSQRCSVTGNFRSLEQRRLIARHGAVASAGEKSVVAPPVHEKSRDNRALTVCVCVMCCAVRIVIVQQQQRRGSSLSPPPPPPPPPPSPRSVPLQSTTARRRHQQQRRLCAHTAALRLYYTRHSRSSSNGRASNNGSQQPQQLAREKYSCLRINCVKELRKFTREWVPVKSTQSSIYPPVSLGRADNRRGSGYAGENFITCKSSFTRGFHALAI
uniref:Uncharacterized protein n=1 Tax=Trichogramma kaykai TaxID=54128 RepID=A0ABD2WDH6_9HYME